MGGFAAFTWPDPANMARVRRAAGISLRIALPAGWAYTESVKKSRTLYIKNPAAHRLAERLSRRMGVTLTDAVIYALEDQIRAAKKPLNREKIDAICARIASLPVLDSRSADEILGYDEFGVPR